MDMYDDEVSSARLESSGRISNEDAQNEGSASFRPETHAQEAAAEEPNAGKEEWRAERPQEAMHAKTGAAEESAGTVLTEMCNTIMDSVKEIDAKVSRLENDVEKVKSGMNEIQGYRDAVTQLKISLKRNQENEERIYKDLEIAKKDERFMMIKPLLDSIVSIHMELLNSKVQYEEDKEAVVREYGEKAYKEIISLHDYQMKNIEGILQNQGVELIWHLPDTPFNSMEQMVSKNTEPTEDASKKDVIVRSETPCYRYNDKVLRKAKVVMYKVTK